MLLFPVGFAFLFFFLVHVLSVDMACVWGLLRKGANIKGVLPKDRRFHVFLLLNRILVCRSYSVNIERMLVTEGLHSFTQKGASGVSLSCLIYYALLSRGDALQGFYIYYSPYFRSHLKFHDN
jgi:hypothetical protein